MLLYKPLPLYIFMGLLFISACDSQPIEPEPDEPIYVIKVEDETFRVRINDAVTQQQADTLLTNGTAINIDGPLRPGNGEFNAPYSWHLDPDSITFSPFTIELCDGMPSFVEEDIDYWLNTVGAYCPWGIQVIAKE